jgi:hypothetical protein
MTAARPCACDRFVPGRPYLADRDCADCWLYAHRPSVRRAWGGPPDAGAAADGPPPGPRFEWVSTTRLVAEAVRLAGLLPPVCGVAGIPRSGMSPAAVIATHLQLPLYQLTEDGRLDRLGHGSRGRTLGFPPARGPVAVVDDTVYGGGAMERARAAVARLGVPALFAAVFVRPEARGAVDVYARLLPSPHLLEWNVMNNGPFCGRAADPVYGAGVALDLDGVIVHDADSGGPVGGAYLVPRTVPCRLIATGRRARHWGATVDHLARVGASWARLEMLPDDAPDDTPEAIAAHKARHYAASGCGFFVESEPVQAAEIFRLTGKPVICPRAAAVWH